MKKAIPFVLCGLSLAAATPWANGQGEPTAQDDAAQVQQLNQQIQTLRQAACLTALTGPGIVLELQDKPNAVRNPSPTAIAGILLQIVNELRAVNAEGISVNGVRLTNYTAIRCVGPKIYVGGQAVNHPYKVEAIGNSEGLQHALRVTHGLHIASRQFAGIDIRLSRATQLRLTSATTTPTFRFGKPE